MQNVKFVLPAVSEIAKNLSVVATVTSIPQRDLSEYIENTEYNAFFAELEPGQTFFYTGKKKDGIFLKVNERSAMLIMPNIAEGNDELYAALYGQIFKFKTDTPITVISTILHFARPNVVSDVEFPVQLSQPDAAQSLTEHKG